MANAGSKIPVVMFVIPVPDQVPPGEGSTKSTAASVSQNGPTVDSTVFGFEST